MPHKANVINLDCNVPDKKESCVRLASGWQVLITSNEKDDRIDILANKGDITMTVRLTDAGPVISMQGACLELKSTETLTLDAKKIKIKARDEASIESKGTLDIDAADEMEIKSGQDVRVKGKMIHLN